MFWGDTINGKMHPSNASSHLPSIHRNHMVHEDLQGTGTSACELKAILYQAVSCSPHRFGAQKALVRIDYEKVREMKEWRSRQACCTHRCGQCKAHHRGLQWQTSDTHDNEAIVNLCFF